MDSVLPIEGLTPPMYMLGHYGIALLVYAPVGTAVAGLGHESVAIVGGLVCLALSTLPDVDQQLSAIDHRGPTHSIVFALLVGAVVAGVASILLGIVPSTSSLSAGWLVAFAFLVGTLSIGSHLLGDVLTPMGIKPFWPLSTRNYTINVTKAANRTANYVLFGFGVGATIAAVAVVSMIA